MFSGVRRFQSFCTQCSLYNLVQSLRIKQHQINSMMIDTFSDVYAPIVISHKGILYSNSLLSAVIPFWAYWVRWQTLTMHLHYASERGIDVNCRTRPGIPSMRLLQKECELKKKKTKQKIKTRWFYRMDDSIILVGEEAFYTLPFTSYFYQQTAWYFTSCMSAQLLRK